jgi:hypothetical protein
VGKTAGKRKRKEERGNARRNGSGEGTNLVRCVSGKEEKSIGIHVQR